MARRAKTKVTVSLFPFMSILACVIGTLTLMLTAMALGQMDNDVVLSAERYEKVETADRAREAATSSRLQKNSRRRNPVPMTN